MLDEDGRPVEVKRVLSMNEQFEAGLLKEKGAAQKAVPREQAVA